MRSSLVAALALSLLVISCATVGPGTASPGTAGSSADDSPVDDGAADDGAASDAEGRLPPVLEALHPDAHQRVEIQALLEKVKSDLEPVVEASRHFLRAVAVAAKECKGDSTVIGMEAESTIAAGEQMRGSLLGAIQKLHHILTPAQRRALSQRLLDADRDNRQKNRSEDDESRTRSLGGDLDLSVGQMFSLLVRVQLLRSSFEDEVAPWRARYRKALRAFAKRDFDVRAHAVAEAPIVEFGTRLVRDALRLLVPVLDPPQCKKVGRMLEKALAEKKERKKKEGKKERAKTQP